MKKKIIACLGLLGLAMTSLFVSPIKSNAAAPTQEATDIATYSFVAADGKILPDCFGDYEYLTRTLDETPTFTHFNIRTYGCDFGENYAITDALAIIDTDENNGELHWDKISCDDPNAYGFVLCEDNSTTKNYFRSLGAKFLELTIYQCWDTNGSVLDLINTWDEVLAVAVPGSIFRSSEWGYIEDHGIKKMVVDEDTSVYEVDNQAPVPNVPANFVVNIDDMLTQEQVLSHVIVEDETDPNPQLVVKSSAYNPSNRTTGTYPIVFYAEDASGNKSIDYTFNVVVADVTNPTNLGFGVHTQPNNVKLTDEEILDLFTVSDNYSTVDKIDKFLNRNLYASMWNIPGTYQVMCRAIDEAGNKTDTTSYILVIDKTAPTNTPSDITIGNDALWLDDVDLKDLFTVSDDVSSTANITKTLLADGYTANWNIPGDYNIICRATDEAGNYTDSTAIVTIVDKTAPLLKGQTIDVEYSEKITDLKSLFEYSDDVSDYENIQFVIDKDEYTSSYDIKGIYQIEAHATDEAGNIGYDYAILRVVDRTKPIITVPTEITVGNSAYHTLEELMSKIVVVDGYDGVITDYSITDDNDYATNFGTVGKYKFTITASDAESNTQTATATFNVIDSTSPTIKYDKYVIVLSQGEELTIEMIKSYASQSLGVAEAAILTIEGEYDTSEMGMYALSLYMRDGSVQPFSISVGESYKTVHKNFWSAEGWSFGALFSFNKWTDWNIAIWATWVGGGLAIVLIASGVYAYRRKKKGK